MKILFIDNFPFNFGLASLSAILKNAGHKVELLYYPFSKWTGIDNYTRPEKYFSFPKICNEILSKQPDIIGFSVFSSNYIFYKTLAAQLKSVSKIPIIIGGVYPTLNPVLMMEQTTCDFLFRGEAEPVIAQLMPAIHANSFHSVPNLVYRDKKGSAVFNEASCFIDNLDSLPFYDKNLYPVESIALYIITSRGCSMKCSYCSAGKYTQMIVRDGERLIRKRNVDSVIGEIKEAQAIKKYKEVFFFDDFFISSQSWLKEFSEKYKNEIGLPYSCIAFPASLKERNVSLLAESGCKLVLMGFQTANEKYKREVLLRNESNATVAEAIKTLKKHKVNFTIDHIFNLPGETREDIGRSLDFYLDNKIHELSINYLNYYPESGITDYAFKNGYMTEGQYLKIINCELIGEQSYKGTILDNKKASEQVKYAILFRTIGFLPASWVRFMFRKNAQKMFPANRYFYYFILIFVMLFNRGLQSVIVGLYFSIPFISKLSRKKKPNRP